MNRRRFLRVVGGGVAACAGVAAGWAWAEDTWDLRLMELEVPVPRLPPKLDGLRIAHLSDLHLGKEVPTGFVLRAMEIARRTSPDLVVLTGDFVSYQWSDLQQVERALSQLAAPRGVYACLGNHDVIGDRPGHVTQILEAAGATVLSNRAVPMGGCAQAWIVGLDDPVTMRHDYELALGSVPAGAFTLLLAHAPDIAGALPQLGVDLALVGHTHGGQVNLPFVGATMVPSRYGPRYASGLFDCQGSRLFVTKGVGLVKPAIRILCPPEVALLTLCRDDWELPTGRYGLDLRQTARNTRRALRNARQRLRKLISPLAEL